MAPDAEGGTTTPDRLLSADCSHEGAADRVGPSPRSCCAQRRDHAGGFGGAGRGVEDSSVGSGFGAAAENPRRPDHIDEEAGDGCERASQDHRRGVHLQLPVHLRPEEGVPDALVQLALEVSAQGQRYPHMGNSSELDWVRGPSHPRMPIASRVDKLDSSSRC